MTLCIYHCLEAIAYTKLAINIVCMSFDRPYCNKRCVGYFLIGHTSGYTA